MKNTTKSMKTGLLLVGHGSRLEYNKQLIITTAELMKKQKPEYLIKSCFMEFSNPTVTEALEEMKKEDVDALVVVPLFLAKGMHVLRDIPNLLHLEHGSKKGELKLISGKTIPLLYAEPIGIDPLLAELMLKNAETALSMVTEP
ncbi:MAG TPA: sirohydrochlorin nickelochelatase [Methanocorpusculum sp.]|nr:sirohydrochlorin nickelochelatase [Methanocorpusculum sp.]